MKMYTFTKVLSSMIFVGTIVAGLPTAYSQTNTEISVVNGFVTVHFEDVDLATVVKAIGEQATPPFTVVAFYSRKSTMHFFKIPLEDALHRLMQKNYTLVLDKKTHKPLKIFLLTEGNGVQKVLLDQDAATNFQEVLINDPQKTVRTQVIMPVPIDLATVNTSLVSKEVTLRSLQHSFGAQGGGYILREGETINEALENYTQSHKLFLENMRTQMKTLVDSAPNSEIHNAALQGLTDLEDVQNDFLERGLQITNLELSGKAVDIQQFVESAQMLADIVLIPEHNR